MQNNTLYMQAESLIYLQGRCSELMAGSTLRDLWEVIDQALEDVGGVQITVVVDVDVHHTLGIWGVVEQTEHKLCIIVLKQKETPIMLHCTADLNEHKPAHILVRVWMTIHLCS